MLPFYEYQINESGDETGQDFNAFVDTPAHMKKFHYFSCDEKLEKYTFSEDKRIVTGVMISANTPIYRNDDSLGEHYGVFTPSTIFKMAVKFFKNNFSNNVNLMHDDKNIVDGVVLFESFILDSKRGINAPIEFKNQNLQDGSLIVSYYVENPEVWAKVKSGEYQGFSIEAVLDKKKIKIKTNKKQEMKKEKMTLVSLFKKYFEEDTTEDVVSFTDVTDLEGTVLSYEGELAMDTAIFVTDENGDKLPAPSGDYQITDAESKIFIVSVDENGIISNVEEVVAEENNADEEMKAEILEEVAELMKATFAKIDSLTEKNEKLSLEIKAIKEEKTSKFESDSKTGASSKGKMSVSEILKNKN